MYRSTRWFAAALTALLVPATASAQINFQKTGYYLGLGDSVAAGEGAMPVTTGYVYRLYDEGVFGAKQDTDFANAGIRGGRTWEFRDAQVAEVLCAAPALRPTVVTITVGANDFLRGDTNIFGIASRVVEGINRLLNNGTAYVSTPVLDPASGAVCPPLSNVTILVSNYYSIPHPVPQVAALLDSALSGFDMALRFLVPQVHVPSGSRLALVDLYHPSLDREGLVLVERRLGFTGPMDFEVHPTNAGHAFIAAQFAAAWQKLQ
jgi:hypothetical protein